MSSLKEGAEDIAENRRLAVKAYRAAWARANKEKCREYSRRFRVNNPHRVSEIKRKHRERHPEKLAEYDREYARSHRAEKAAALRAWRKANPDKVKEQERRRSEKNPNRKSEYYARNKEQSDAYVKQWRRKNPEKDRAISRKNQHRRRAIMSLSPETYTLSEIRALRKTAGKKCAFCGIGGRMTVDHIVPLARGGDNGIRNIQFLCKPCNSKKHDKDPLHFAREQGLLL